MAYEVQITEAAAQDLNEILGYIVNVLKNPSAASLILHAFDERRATLREHPFAFQKSQDPDLRRRGYRKFLISDYIFLYQVDEARSSIFVSRVFYGRQQYKNKL